MKPIKEGKKGFLSSHTLLLFAIVIGITVISVSSSSFAGVPWYITGAGAVAGGIAGSLTGSPIGTIAGATAGAILANYLYQIFNSHNSNQALSVDNVKLAIQYARNYENITASDLVSQRNVANTIINLADESYYYNAQQEEAIAPYYLNQSSLNLFNISMASGEYATLNNISESLYQPAQTVLYDTFSTSNASDSPYFSNNPNSVGINLYTNLYSYSQVGIPLVVGDIIYIPYHNAYTLFRVNNELVSIGIQNIFNSNESYIIGNDNNGHLASGTTPYSPIISNGPNGWYKIINLTGTVLTGGIEIKPNGMIVDTSSNTVFTATFPTSSGIVSGNVWNAVESKNGSNYLVFYAGTPINYVPGYTVNKSLEFNGMPNFYINLNQSLLNVYSASNSYFTLLKDEGYTNIKQLPANMIYPFPSDVVPPSMLNGTFNSQELLALYTAYLNDLNRTFHNTTLYNGHNYTKYFNQSEFVNGFLTVYGNLQYTSNNKTLYLNKTDFFIQTYDKNLYFQVGKTTQLTGEQFPVLILNGTQNGTLIYVDASIYVLGLTLAGKNITNYELMPVQISYVTSLGFSAPPLTFAGLLISASNFLEKYYLYVTVGLLLIVGASYYSYDKKNKSRGKHE